jgi:hypothetical protein
MVARSDPGGRNFGGRDADIYEDGSRLPGVIVVCCFGTGFAIIAGGECELQDSDSNR